MTIFFTLWDGFDMIYKQRTYQIQKRNDKIYETQKGNIYPGHC